MQSNQRFDKTFPSEFLELLFGDALDASDCEIEVRCIAKGKPVVRHFAQSITQLRKFWPKLLDLNRQKYNILISVVPRDPKNHKPVEPIALTFLWADADLNASSKDKALRELAQLIGTCHPSIRVDSGHGQHLYFLLDRPIKTNTTGAKILLRALATRLKADLQSAEPARLLRVPNTLNWKDERDPAACKILSLRSTRRYSAAEITGPIRIPRLRQTLSDAPDDYFGFYGRYITELRKTSGGQAMGLCPFHPDNHPSFSLRVGDGVWHCFGCGRSGNALSFCLMKRIDVNICPRAARLQEHNALAVENGGYVTWRRRGDGWEKRRISNFTIEWEEENRVSDKIRLEDRVFKGNLCLARGEPIRVRFSNDDLCSNAQFYQRLVLEAGAQISISEHDVGNIRRASFLFSEARQIETSMDFGFQDDTRFLTQSLVITSDGVRAATEGTVDLGTVEHACYLELKKLSLDRVADLLEHIQTDLLELQPYRVTYPLLGFLGAAPLMSFMEDTTRYALWLVGQSGTGKSFIAKLFQCFFGDFIAEGRPVSWTSTVNSLQFMGYFFKDCLYLVDDYKPVMVHGSGEVVRFLQNYADFYGRSRLTSEIKSRKDYYVRGSLLTTGEDMPVGHASLIARSLIVAVPKRSLDTARGSRCLSLCKDYSGITARYIRFLLRLRDLRKTVNSLVGRYHQRFLKDAAREDNSVRVARNLALNVVGFRYFTRFLKANKACFDVEEMRREHQKTLFALRDQMFDLINKENPGKIFLQAISEALGSGRARLMRANSTAGAPGAPAIGFDKDPKDGVVSVFPREAMALVKDQEWRTGRDFDWSPNAVSKQLIALGALAKRQGRNDAGTSVRFQGKLHRVWMLRTRYLGMEEPEDDEKTVT